jgi:uncharacterized Zn-finger protein
MNVVIKNDLINTASLYCRFMKMEEDMDSYDDDLEDEILSDVESDEEYGTMYNCNICKATNMALKDFLSHSKLHTKEEKQSALAKIVNSKIVREEAAKSAAVAFGFRVQESLESSVTLYQCIVCGQGNLMLKDVREHSSIHPQYIESHFCSICQTQFQTHKSLNAHLEVHLDNNDLICQYCNKTFEMIDDLEAHEDQHYVAEYMCVECRECFKSKELVLVHLRVSHSEDTTCVICDVDFKSAQLLNKHFVSHAVIQAMKRLTPSFCCEHCFKKYDSKVAVQRHKVFLHSNRIPFICEYCGFFAYHEDPLRAHLEKNHIGSRVKCVCFKCGPVDIVKDNKEIPEDKLTPLENFCRFCGLEFKSNFSLKAHFKSHGEVRNSYMIGEINITTKSSEDSMEEPSFVCYRCGEIFTANDLCLTHSSYHVDCVLCDLCGKPFKNEIALNYHLNFVHSNKCQRSKEESTLPFKCKRCNLFFKLEFELEEHNITHEEVRYQCHFCFKEFIADCDLQDHLNCHTEEFSEIE